MKRRRGQTGYSRKGGHQCPVCGKSWAGQAQAWMCSATKACRALHHPRPKTAREWRIQSMTAVLMQQLGTALVDEGGDEARIAGQRILTLVGQVWIQVRDTHPVGVGYTQRQGPALRDCLLRLWPDDAPLHITCVLEVLLLLVEDVQTHLSGHQHQTVWNVMETCLTAELRRVDPDSADCGESSRTTDIYEGLRSHIFAESGPRPERLRLYDMGGRFLVAARRREEARNVLREELGLTGLKARGLSDGTKLEISHVPVTAGGYLKRMKSPGLVCRLEDPQ